MISIHRFPKSAPRILIPKNIFYFSNIPIIVFTVSCGWEACQSSGYKLHSPKGTLPVAGLTWDIIPDLSLVNWANLSPLIGPYLRQPTWALGSSSRDPDQSHNLVSGSQSEIYLRALKFILLKIWDTADTRPAVSFLPSVDCRMTFCFIFTGESQNLGKY